MHSAFTQSSPRSIEVMGALRTEGGFDSETIMTGRLHAARWTNPTHYLFCFSTSLFCLIAMCANEQFEDNGVLLALTDESNDLTVMLGPRQKTMKPSSNCHFRTTQLADHYSAQRVCRFYYVIVVSRSKDSESPDWNNAVKLYSSAFVYNKQESLWCRVRLGSVIHAAVIE